MSIAIIDTSIIIHYFRKDTQSISWINQQPRQFSITSITWLEVMRGATSKNNQAILKNLLNRFEILYTTSSDQKWAMNQLEKFHFSHRIGMNDCQIASVAYRLRIPLYTHNLKHMTPLVGNLAQKPY